MSARQGSLFPGQQQTKLVQLLSDLKTRPLPPCHHGRHALPSPGPHTLGAQPAVLVHPTRRVRSCRPIFQDARSSSAPAPARGLSGAAAGEGASRVSCGIAGCPIGQSRTVGSRFAILFPRSPKESGSRQRAVSSELFLLLAGEAPCHGVALSSSPVDGSQFGHSGASTAGGGLSGREGGHEEGNKQRATAASWQPA